MSEDFHLPIIPAMAFQVKLRLARDSFGSPLLPESGDFGTSPVDGWHTSHFSHCCDKYLTRNRFQDGFLWLEFQGVLSYGREGVTAGSRDVVEKQLTSFCSLSGTPAHEAVLATVSISSQFM